MSPDLTNALTHYVWNPVWNTFCGLFDWNGRLGLPFLVVSLSVAYFVYRWQRQRGYSQADHFPGFLGGRKVWLHRSALNDYVYYFIRPLLHLLFIVPVMALLDPQLLKSGDVTQFLSQVWGARPRLGENMALMLLYGFGAFLVSDFAHYWLHRAFHCRWLWEFHKVHHSAVVMVPATASRIHFFEKLSEMVLKGVCLALFGGTFFWLCGGKVSAYTLFGVSYLTFIFNALAANLRHSHIWLSFGPKIEHIINSPAQHQIHHSRDPRHFNRNFGTNLSLWDWMFGTLYVTTPQPEHLEFGVAPQDNERYLKLHNLIVRPFWVTALKLWRLVRPVGTTTQPQQLKE
ncbi:sterol desaturase family protein [Tolumonas osonensis]|uniref:Sterol desaturase/sphingolipid hydroxylase (Fatty acid hydroxylase superfamily) n=1 Tax=Tolumonas osonensis TaxID=675874 RepID=A0A841GR33_9GAMM|nr:sterol desaturase family protein [Tolumonas osonensis]MBB6056093.1 sterol desaturase/sphingolipid hydroxylase (fatty acid hydroxylase superfamily) [Tolumonas osonensis]